MVINKSYRIDLVVEDLMAVELKSVEAILPVHRGQLLSYLRLGNFKLGYLLNFNVAHMRDGIVRMVNRLLCLRVLRAFLCALRVQDVPVGSAPSAGTIALRNEKGRPGGGLSVKPVTGGHRGRKPSPSGEDLLKSGDPGHGSG